MPAIKTVKSSQIREIVERQNYRCALTGRELTPVTASLDHIVPVSRGGDHVVENLWVVHHQVNTAKGTMTVEEFVQMCREVVSHMQNKADSC